MRRWFPAECRCPSLARPSLPTKSEAAAAIVAFAISLGYIIYPGPYVMGAFIFIAQPLFVVAAAGYAVKVLRELKRHGIF